MQMSGEKLEAALAAQEDIPANCCFNCAHEKTCGYSPLAILGYRADYGKNACCLGLRSNGEPFFVQKG